MSKTYNMEEQNKPTEQKTETKVAEAKPETKETPKTETKPTETKTTENKTKAPNSVPSAKGKTEAVVNAQSLPISTKHAIAICNMMRNMNIDDAIKKLELAEKMKIPVPMRGEIPHRKGIMSGRYPVKALGHIIKVLESLKSNALVNELELEKYVIFCKANVASRPYKRFGKGRFKKTNLQVKLIQNIKKQKNNK